MKYWGPKELWNLSSKRVTTIAKSGIMRYNTCKQSAMNDLGLIFSEPVAASRGEASHVHTDQEEIEEQWQASGRIYRRTLCKSSQPAFAMIHQKNTARENITIVGYNRMLRYGMDMMPNNIVLREETNGRKTTVMFLTHLLTTQYCAYDRLEMRHIRHHKISWPAYISCIMPHIYPSYHRSNR